MNGPTESSCSRTARGLPRRRRDVTGPGDVVDPRLAALDDLVEEYPEEDVPADPADLLVLYVWGSRPRCEEQEYIERIEDVLGDDGL